jgi:HEPN domain-containing protein
VVGRARSADAHALILSGSTARGSRTEISDLDYHLVGDKIATRDLSTELDLHVLSTETLTAQILDGDDFVQWSIRFGRVLFDDGTVLDAARLIAEERPWPDAERKIGHAVKSLDLARRVVETGDSDGAVIQVRTALSLAARAHLLSVGRFPMSRAELPDQLAAAGRPESAAALEACIHGHPSLEALGKAVSEGHALLGTLATGR